MQFGELKSLLEGKFEPEQIASLMEFALAIVHMRETEDYRRLWQTLEHMGQRIEQLTEKLQELYHIVGGQAKAIETLTHEVAELKETTAGLVQTVGQHSEEIRELRKILQELAQMVSQNTQQLSQHSQEISELRKTTQELVEITKQHSEQLSQHSQEISELRKTVQELVEITKRHSQEISELRKTTQELVEITKQHSEQLSQHSQEISELRKITQELVETVKKLNEEHKKTREHLGGLSHTVGYVLENQAYKHLPRLLRDEGVEVIGKLKRGFVEYSGTSFDEVNILGKAMKDSVEVFIIGEGKTQLAKKHVDEFLRKLHRIQRYLDAEVVPVLVTHMVVSPQVDRYARQKGIKLYYSYEFEE